MVNGPHPALPRGIFRYTLRTLLSLTRRFADSIAGARTCRNILRRFTTNAAKEVVSRAHRLSPCFADTI
jgi:hypothetical protein